MPTQLIKPMHVQRFEILCNVGDAIVANLAMNIVFFFERDLDTVVLRRAFARALTNLPIFAARMATGGGPMRIRCRGQGVPLTSVASERTLREAICSVWEDKGSWLVDAVNGVTARWGLSPLCKVRVTHLADDATAIGFSWHHAVGDMQTLMHFMNAWSAAATGKVLAEPLIVADRAAYLDEHLPADGAREPGVRCLRFTEIVRGARYLAREARKQRTLSVCFGDDEIVRMREAYGSRMRLSANDVVCAHICEALMNADEGVARRTLAIVVNARTRCGLDPMLVGNIITTLNLELRRGEPATSIAERIRHNVDHFADQHCDMRANQRFLDAGGRWRAARCVTAAFSPVAWNPIVTNLSSFGVYRLQFEDTFTSYCTVLMTLPVAGSATLMEGAHGSGLVFRMALPLKDFQVMSAPAVREYMHRFRCSTAAS
ncbi:acyltransferase [Mycolicibacterium sp. ND9-15]|uniref:acyltransferase n=1 Tax=Mycolicibacterium sp. ND9-15 TaxID=3042320 RepID=UPI002DD8EAAB|nr:acyltransferase [Mycolicibacterium sp. ND9-15]WSE54739.1 acyltransferase [Mycolicibacterium sp. ND9-15]